MTRAGRINVGYLGKSPSDPKDSLENRLAQRAGNNRRVKMIANNVGELMEILKSLNPSARVLTIDPPFGGLKVVDQGDGSFLFCRPSAPESKATSVSRS